MDALTASMLDWAVRQGPGVAMLLFAIWWLNNQNGKAAKEAKVALDNAEAHVKTAFDAAVTERNKRFEYLESMVQNLTTRSDTCDRDRQALWQKLVELSNK